METSNQGSKSEVRVLAFDTFGRFLGAPDVILFTSDDDHRNFADRFHNGTARGIPEGTYQIEARLTAYYSDSKPVRVYGRTVSVVLGLEFGNEASKFPPALSGKIIGKLSTSNNFVRLVGIYSNLGIDSTIDSHGSFTITGLSDGRFLLLVVGEKGILVS